jgi:hypothetical protein
MVNITKNKHYYPPLTSVPSTLISCKLSRNNNNNEEKKKKEKWIISRMTHLDSNTHILNIIIVLSKINAVM